MISVIKRVKFCEGRVDANMESFECQIWVGTWPVAYCYRANIITNLKKTVVQQYCTSCVGIEELLNKVW